MKSRAILIARPAGRGFSLLEVLVSISILSLLLVLLLSMVDSATRLWRSNENRVDAYREARAAINTMAKDLGSIRPLPGTDFFFTDADSEPSVPNSASANHMKGRLFFVSALPLEEQTAGAKSDLCTVGYFLAYERTGLVGGGPKSYNLYRYLLSSNETFPGLRDGNLSAKIEPDASPTGNAELLAKNIVGFEVKAWTVTPAATAGGAATLSQFTKSAATPAPDLVEITLQAISNDAARRLSPTTAADWERQNDPRLKQDVRKFTTRIAIPSAENVKTNPVVTP